MTKAQLAPGCFLPISEHLPMMLMVGSTVGDTLMFPYLRLRKRISPTRKIGCILWTKNLPSGSENCYPIPGQSRKNVSNPPRIILPGYIYLRG